MQPRPTTLAEHAEALAQHWELHLPEGAGPFPVIIQLHGCGGKKPFMTTYAKLARDAGAAVIVIDSHAPRRIAQMTAYTRVCTGTQLPGRERAADLFAAMTWARRQSWADPNRIAASGWSHGGWTIADALSFRDRAEMARATGLEDIKGEPLDRLSAVFLVYPYLGPLSLRERPWRIAPRVNAILCGRDVIAGGKWPREALARVRAQGADVDIVMFDKATHAFDEPEAKFAAFAYDAALVARGHRLYEDFARSL